jgi:hypothetical protein
MSNPKALANRFKIEPDQQRETQSDDEYPLLPSAEMAGSASSENLLLE